MRQDHEKARELELRKLEAEQRQKEQELQLRQLELQLEMRKIEVQAGLEEASNKSQGEPQMLQLTWMRVSRKTIQEECTLLGLLTFQMSA